MTKTYTLYEDLSATDRNGRSMVLPAGTVVTFTAWAGKPGTYEAALLRAPSIGCYHARATTDDIERALHIGLRPTVEAVAARQPKTLFAKYDVQAVEDRDALGRIKTNSYAGPSCR